MKMYKAYVRTTDGLISQCCLGGCSKSDAGSLRDTAAVLPAESVASRCF